VISRIELVVNVALPLTVINGASSVSLVRLLRSARRSNQAGAQPDAAAVDSETRYIRSTSIAQLCAALAFTALGLPAHAHELSVMLDSGSQTAPVGFETYMTQRLLLVVLYSRCSSTFVVHVAANRVFRRRLAAVLRRRSRRRPACCGPRRRAADVPGDISLSSIPTMSRAADGDRFTDAVATTRLND